MNNNKNIMEEEVTEREKENGKPRTLIVMDEENINHGTNNQLGQKTDYGAIDGWIHSDFNVLDKIAYVDRFGINGQRRVLNRLGWSIRAVVTKKKDLSSKATVLVKNAVDLELALDTYEFVRDNRPDLVVLIAGDGDYLPLVKRVRKLNIDINVMALKSSTSNVLVKFVDGYKSYGSVIEEYSYRRIKNKKDAIKAIRTLMKAHFKDRVRVNASELKQELLNLDPYFSEKRLGYGKFKKLLEDIEQEAKIILYQEDTVLWVSSRRDIAHEAGLSTMAGVI